MREELFNQLVESVREGGAILRGEIKPARITVIEVPNIKRIRENYKLSQGQFAGLLGISTATLQNWEQGRRTPKGAARVLLQVAAKHPDAVWDVVKSSGLTSSAKSRTGKVAKARNGIKKMRV